VLVNCGPRGLPEQSVTLYHNDGHGRFTDVTRKAGLADVRGYGLTTVAADFDNDGWPDLYVACDTTPSLLFRNQRDGTFAEEGLERGVALNEDGREQAGMGIAVGDHNLDGSLDILKTHFASDTSNLFLNDGKGWFRDVTMESGIGVETRYVCWGTGFADFDNNGYPDLFVVGGGVYPEVEKTFPDFPYRTPRMVFRNLDGKKFEELIEEAGPGVSAAHSSRGCAFGDFDNDGDVDIVIVNMNEPPSLLRNDVTGANHWIKVKLVGVKSNRSALGARVTVQFGGKKQAQEVLGQSSYLSVNDRRLHFGLGEVTKVDIKIRWPNGMIESLERVDADQLVVVREGAGIVDKVRLNSQPPTR
jgi:enediyne biosynthesis protein E4